MGFRDFLVIGLAALVLGMMFIFAHYTFTILEDTPLNATYPEFGVDDSPIVQGKTMMASLDWLGGFVAVGLTVAVFASSFYIRSHPIFGIIGFFFALFWFLFAPVIANAWIAFAGTPMLAASANEFPIFNAVLVYFPVWAFVLGIVSSIIFYGKDSRGGGVGF